MQPISDSLHKHAGELVNVGHSEGEIYAEHAEARHPREGESESDELDLSLLGSSFPMQILVLAFRWGTLQLGGWAKPMKI